MDKFQQVHVAGGSQVSMWCWRGRGIQCGRVGDRGGEDT